ncbi:MAG: sensor histidine kinase, partial [Flavobacteriales bacterium]
ITDLEKKTELKNIYKDLEFIKSHISSALENSRKITYELSPPVLYQLGIVDALDWYAEETQNKYGIKFQFNSNVDAVKLSDFKSILIFRCIQEAVTNTIKYAEASLITLELIKDKNAVNILITDNGKGFDTAVLKASGSS